MLSVRNSKEYMGKAKVDYAVLVCAKAEQNCPSIYPFAMNVLSWPFEDPVESCHTSDELLEKFREIRDAIGGRIEQWLEEGEIRAFVERLPGSLAE
jgi:arsenate reductase